MDNRSTKASPAIDRAIDDGQETVHSTVSEKLKVAHGDQHKGDEPKVRENRQHFRALVSEAFLRFVGTTIHS
jgi:hypothetical protein